MSRNPQGEPRTAEDDPSDFEVARWFHEAYERLAPEFGYATRRESAVPWDEVPEQNRRLMMATVAEVRAALRAVESLPHPETAE